MKKRLLIIFSIFLVVVVLLIVCSTVFTVQNAEIYFYNEEGKMVVGDSSIVPSGMIKDFVGDNIFFLSESKLIDNIHSKSDYVQWYVVGVTRLFPNTVAIHLTKRIPVFFLSTGGQNYLVDVLGYVVQVTDSSSTSGYVDVSDFGLKVNSPIVGQTLTMKDDVSTARFDALRTVVRTVWRFNYNYNEVSTFISSYSFSEDALTLVTGTGAKIVLNGYDNSVESKMISAVSVYNSDKLDMTGENVVITVDQKGRVTSTNSK